MRVFSILHSHTLIEFARAAMSTHGVTRRTSQPVRNTGAGDATCSDRRWTTMVSEIIEELFVGLRNVHTDTYNFDTTCTVSLDLIFITQRIGERHATGILNLASPDEPMSADIEEALYTYLSTQAHFALKVPMLQASVFIKYHRALMLSITRKELEEFKEKTMRSASPSACSLQAAKALPWRLKTVLCDAIMSTYCAASPKITGLAKQLQMHIMHDRACRLPCYIDSTHYFQRNKMLETHRELCIAQHNIASALFDPENARVQRRLLASLNDILDVAYENGEDVPHIFLINVSPSNILAACYMLELSYLKPLPRPAAPAGAWRLHPYAAQAMCAIDITHKEHAWLLIACRLFPRELTERTFVALLLENGLAAAMPLEMLGVAQAYQCILILIKQHNTLVEWYNVAQQLPMHAPMPAVPRCVQLLTPPRMQLWKRLIASGEGAERFGQPVQSSRRQYRTRQFRGAPLSWQTIPEEPEQYVRLSDIFA